MEAATQRGARRVALPYLRKMPEAHLLVLIGGAIAIALGAALVAVRITVPALDETLIQQSAVHYSSGLPHTLLHDVDARATNRLYSLILSIAYRITGGPDALRIERVLSVLMFVSAVFPIYLMARRLLASSAVSVAVALLSVLAPWLTLTTALFTENLSYPLFWWALLACCTAIERPRMTRDLLALFVIALLVGTRVQFAAIALGYVLCVAVACLARAAPPKGGTAFSRARSRVLAASRLALRGFAATVAVAVVVLAGLLYARASGQWHAHVSRLLGTYSNVVIRNGLPPNMAEGVLIEVIALALGVGLLPAFVAVPWYTRALSRPRSDSRWLTLAVCGAILLVFLLATVYSQGGYLGAVTEERYFFYVIPVLWIGAFAAVAERSVRAGEVMICAAGFAVLYATIPFLSPLTSETAFLAPVESVVPHLLQQRLNELGLGGTTVQDALFATALAAGALTALIWRSRPVAAARWVIGAAVVAQLVIAGYAYAVIDGHVTGIPGRTGGSVSSLGWVDAAAGGHQVTWLDNENVDAPPALIAPQAGLAANQTHVTLFYNSDLRSWAEVPATGLPPVEFPLTGLPGQASLGVDPATGLLGPAGAGSLSYLVGQTDSPFLQVAGAVLGRSPDGFLTLTRTAQPARASWFAEGLPADGGVQAGAAVKLRAFAAAAPANGIVATFTLGSVSPIQANQPATELLLAIGSRRRLVRLSAGATTKTVIVTGCGPSRGGPIRGSVSAPRTQLVQGRALGGFLLAVALKATPCALAHP